MAPSRRPTVICAHRRLPISLSVFYGDISTGNAHDQVVCGVPAWYN